MIHLPRTPYSARETLFTARRMFRRSPSAPIPPATLTLASDRSPERWIGFAGDVMPLMGREGRASRGVVDFFAECDWIVANLEGIVTPHRWFPFLQKHTPPIFSYLAGVAPASRWVLSVANNHAPDYGDDGLDRTLAAIDAAGMQHVGTLERPRFDLGRGATVTAWTEWTNGATARVPTRDPGAPDARGLHFGFPHWGYEFEAAPRPDQRRALPRGYDVVVGHHSHTAQPPELVDGRVVAWSLGNFFSEVRLPTMGSGAILKVGVASDETGLPVPVVAHVAPVRLDRSDRRLCTVETL